MRNLYHSLAALTLAASAFGLTQTATAGDRVTVIYTSDSYHAVPYERYRHYPQRTYRGHHDGHHNRGHEHKRHARDSRRHDNRHSDDRRHDRHEHRWQDQSHHGKRYDGGHRQADRYDRHDRHAKHTAYATGHRF